jgi:hypothetical protein
MIVISGLGRARVRTNNRTAKQLLTENSELTSEEKAYLNRIVTEGERFLQLTKANS